VMAIVFLGEKPELFHLIGYIMVVAGIVIASRRKSTAAQSR
jgi:drug/metabolite transporter (DMT)-like permease